jgi:hypothetical protein
MAIKGQLYALAILPAIKTPIESWVNPRVSLDMCYPWSIMKSSQPNQLLYWMSHLNATKLFYMSIISENYPVILLQIYQRLKF